MHLAGEKCCFFFGVMKVEDAVAGCKGFYIGGLIEGYGEAGCSLVAEALKKCGKSLKDDYGSWS
jgi:hypothetical protein